MLNLLKAGQKVNVFKFDGYWLDIGRPDDYERAIDEFAKHRQEFIKE
jgi:NDP-sugar pyrophosphorylase family protein